MIERICNICHLRVKPESNRKIYCKCLKNIVPNSIYCKYCQEEVTTHSQLLCFNKPRTPLKTKKAIDRIGKAGAENQEIRRAWIQANPPPYECYLGISPFCLRHLDIDTMTLEHVIPKSRGRGYARDFKNIRPACYPCNSLKGSRTLEALVRHHPHLQKYIKPVDNRRVCSESYQVMATKKPLSGAVFAIEAA